MISAQPNFFIAGAPKAGTTSLYHYLDQHPEIYMSPVKEANHFASEIQPANFAEEHQDRVQSDMQKMQEYLAGPMAEKRFGAVGLDWDDYLKLFRNAAGEKALGEGSVIYLWSETAAKNISARIPDARIIIILRDPADRAFSQYMQMAKKGETRATFTETCRQAMTAHDGKFRAFRPFLELGLYHRQVERYLECFPRKNIYVGFYENYQSDPSGMMRELLHFLDVRENFQADMSQRHLPGVAGRRIETEDRRVLTDYYREDVRGLADLLNCNLSHWER